jgi:hypothetical protein
VQSDGPLNSEQPPDVPLRPGPSGHLVIARLVWPDRIEFVPALANRWTRTHVLIVQYRRDPSGRLSEVLTWLRATDVRRTIRIPPHT